MYFCTALISCLCPKKTEKTDAGRTPTALDLAPKACLTSSETDQRQTALEERACSESGLHTSTFTYIHHLTSITSAAAAAAPASRTNVQIESVDSQGNATLRSEGIPLPCELFTENEAPFTLDDSGIDPMINKHMPKTLPSLDYESVVPFIKTVMLKIDVKCMNSPMKNSVRVFDKQGNRRYFATVVIKRGIQIQLRPALRDLIRHICTQTPSLEINKLVLKLEESIPHPFGSYDQYTQMRLELKFLKEELGLRNTDRPIA